VSVSTFDYTVLILLLTVCHFDIIILPICLSLMCLDISTLDPTTGQFFMFLC
jgi:hypothetical protein